MTPLSSHVTPSRQQDGGKGRLEEVGEMMEEHETSDKQNSNNEKPLVGQLRTNAIEATR